MKENSFISNRFLFLTVILIAACVTILMLENILVENAVNQTLPYNRGGCWEKESFTVKQACSPCTDFERVSKHLEVCTYSQYKELISCKLTGDVYRACSTTGVQHKFYTFEAIMLLTAIFSSASVILRRRHLDGLMLEKIQQQVAAGV